MNSKNGKRLQNLNFLLILLILTGPTFLYGQTKENGSAPWELVWSDEFDYTGLPDSLRWNFDTRGNAYGWGNNEAQWYTVAKPENVWVANGILRITARKEECNGKKFTSARLITKQKGDWLYGRIEVAAKLPAGAGTWPAIWMSPSDNSYGGWPKSGEIDVMEHVGFDPESVFSTVHTYKFNHTKGTQIGQKLFTPNAITGFHVYTLEWDENEIRSYFDGMLYFTFKNTGGDYTEWPFNRPFYLILNQAVGGGLGGKKGIDESKYPHYFDIDYVRVYQRIK